MKILALIMVFILVVAVGCIFLIPPGTFYVLDPPIFGYTIVISRGEIEFDPGPDHFATNGIEHIEPYVARLMVPSERYRYLHIVTPNGNRGFGLSARGPQIEALLIVDARRDQQREAVIRSFFSSRGVAPSMDLLTESTRVLHYPIAGNTEEVTAVTKQILQEVYTLSPEEALDLSYSTRSLGR